MAFSRRLPKRCREGWFQAVGWFQTGLRRAQPTDFLLTTSLASQPASRRLKRHVLHVPFPSYVDSATTSPVTTILIRQLSQTEHLAFGLLRIPDKIAFAVELRGIL